MLKKLIAAALLLTSGVSGAMAQNLSARIDVGANFANQDVKVSAFDNKIKAGLRVSTALEIALSKSNSSTVYIAPGLTYKMGGTVMSGALLGDLMPKLEASYRTHELALPINFGMRANFAPELAVSLELGPYFSYALAGSYTLGKTTQNIYPDAQKRFDAGINGSVALEYSRYYLRLGAEYGFTDLNKINYATNYRRNMAFFAGVGIRF